MTVQDVASFHVPREVIEAHTTWSECVAFRFRKVNDDSYVLEVSNDLEAITSPEESS